jgi:phosphoglycolate phosphatase
VAASALAEGSHGVSAALFDLDGTLIDSRPGIIGSLHAAIADLSHAPDPAIDLTWAIGPPLDEMMPRILAPYGDTRAAEAVTLYRRHYGQQGLYQVKLYPGIPEVLAGFAAAGVVLCLATSKRTVFARRILENLGLASHFRGIYGTEDGRRFDHKPDLVAHVLREQHIAPGSAVMIGDRVHDIEAAHANSLPAIGAAWGYGGEAELRRAGCDALAESAACLLPLALKFLQSGKLP